MRTPPVVRGAGPVPRWLAELALGARMVAAAGREGWLRTGLTALGVGLGVALLLLGAAVPAILAGREDRGVGRNVPWWQEHEQLAADEHTLLVQPRDTQFRDQEVRGVVLHPDGPAAALPPGLAAFPGPGELVVSPALARLLESADGDLLRPRLDFPVVGIIADEGLRSPRDLAYYLGGDGAAGVRIDHFRADLPDSSPPLSPLLVLLLTVGLVVLLVPVAMCVASAVRFGGEQRDRRLAALRLAGADTAMTSRIAAGEALLAAALGMLAGVGMFLVGRQLAEQVEVFGISVFAIDVRPNLLLAAVVLFGVPALSVGLAGLAMRGLVMEPLAVVRRAAGPRRRLWWRLLLPLAGLALLVPLVGRIDQDNGAFSQLQVVAGVLLLLLGVAVLLPWLVDAVVGRVRGRGGVSWLLASRRLQLAGGSTGRVVNGVVVAAAGAIGLQMLFTAVSGGFVTEDLRYPDRDPVLVFGSGELDPTMAEAAAGQFATLPGVHSVASAWSVFAIDAGRPDGDWHYLTVGTCPALAQRAALTSPESAAEVAGCADGDVFLLRPPPADEPAGPGPGAVDGQAPVPTVQPGQELELIHYPQRDRDGVPIGEPVLIPWTVPAQAETISRPDDPHGFNAPAIFATPGAMAGLAAPSITVEVRLELDPAAPDAIEQVRNAAWGVDPAMRVWRWQPVTMDDDFAAIRLGLLIGLTVTLALIGVSLLVGMVEQLRERRRQLAALVAFGTRRRTLAASVLWQTAIPVVLGMALALVAGVGLGALLVAMIGMPVRLDWPHLATVTGIGAAAVLLVTGLAMPVLWRLMRPDGLRTE